MNKKRIIPIIIAVAATIITAGAVMLSRSSSNKTKMDNNNATISAATESNAGDAMVEIKTSEGTIKVLLYGDTPKHRDNFLKLVREGYYDNVLFHRVINEFMVQAGDPDSKNAPAGKMLGAGDPGYTIDAEFVYPKHFHKRGALAAARQGDQVNPTRSSSGSQFYIVTGKVYNDSTIKQIEQRMVTMQKQQVFTEMANNYRDSILTLRKNRDQAGLQALQDELVAKTEKIVAENPISLTDEQRQVYKTIGGTPHLDNQYTVFGEVVEGMDIVGKIEKVETDSNNRPLNDIRIFIIQRPLSI